MSLSAGDTAGLGGGAQISPEVQVSRSLRSLMRAPRQIQVSCLVQIAGAFQRRRARQEGRGEVGLCKIGTGKIGVGQVGSRKVGATPCFPIKLDGGQTNWL
jgi:hypothetical protein